MSKSKKRVVFFITMIVTIAICCLIFKIISNSLKPAQEYSIYSGISVANNEGILDAVSNYNIESFLDKQGKIKVNIDVYNYNDRNVKYELSVLVNFQQREFQTDKENILTYDFDLEPDNNHKFNVVLNKDVFEYKVNDIVIILRQDTDIYSVDNDLVSDSNTICRHYLITNNLSKKSLNEANEKIKMSSIGDNTDAEVNLKCLNMKSSYGIQTDKGNKLKFRLSMKNGEIGTDYVLICLQEGKQTKINDTLYLSGFGEKEDIEINAPDKEGKYELEVLCIPNLSNVEIGKEQEISVISSNRYTLEVE